MLSAAKNGLVSVAEGYCVGYTCTATRKLVVANARSVFFFVAVTAVFVFSSQAHHVLHAYNVRRIPRRVRESCAIGFVLPITAAALSYVTGLTSFTPFRKSVQCGTCFDTRIDGGCADFS